MQLNHEEELALIGLHCHKLSTLKSYLLTRRSSTRCRQALELFFEDFNLRDVPLPSFTPETGSTTALAAGLKGSWRQS